MARINLRKLAEFVSARYSRFKIVALSSLLEKTITDGAGEVIMSIQKAYNEWSASYDTDENLTRDLDQNVLREALADLHFDSILEIGCGTGKNTLFLSQIGKRVHALDFSEGMIRKAREKVRAANIKFSIADLTKKWPAENESYDLIVCNLVLEHIEDLSFIFSGIGQKDLNSHYGTLSYALQLFYLFLILH